MKRIAIIIAAPFIILGMILGFIIISTKAGFRAMAELIAFMD